jgi:ectoine hydroxylase-related dioxygenase (phytanoyl-CoA dioxygenase family)
MLTRVHGYLLPRRDEAPAAARQLETDGYAVLESVFSAGEIGALRAELEAVYRDYPPDGRSSRRTAEEDEDFRYEIFNRSALAQQAIGHPAILGAIEPLLGEDCHVIANTCWRNPPAQARSHGGGFWHIDAGPHVPRPADVPWDERIPYPVFAVGAHIYLQDCPLACGPTGVIPGSHRSGQPPPRDRYDDVLLTWEGRAAVALTARAGDVAMFVSDVWHRRLPAGAGDNGRFFLQAHYGRRDIAQRVRPTAEINHARAAARERVRSERERRLLGLHENFFYDG